jgi:hypothetical protein
VIGEALGLPVCVWIGSIRVVDNGIIEKIRDDVLQALAGAVLLRDRLAELGDRETTVIALMTVDALNRLLAPLSIEPPTGLAAMVPRRDNPPAPGFVSN